MLCTVITAVQWEHKLHGQRIFLIRFKANIIRFLKVKVHVSFINHYFLYLMLRFLEKNQRKTSKKWNEGDICTKIILIFIQRSYTSSFFLEGTSMLLLSTTMFR